MEIKPITNLIQQVTAITDHYKLISEITGENFNVFRILKVEASEVRMHSSFIAELLNPKGSHGQGDIFLRLFISKFCYKQNELDASSCDTKVELHTAFISDDGKEGGRIDIIVTDKHCHQIIIENKIYAGDQANQLVRYHHYDPNADLFYLTLSGKSPEFYSKGNLQEDTDYKCLSYKNDIVNWLEACHKEASAFPLLRESITQYIHLIKYLTNQTINHAMEKELSTLMKGNIEASFTIVNNLDNALNEILHQYTDQLESICTPLGLKCKNRVSFDERYTGFWIYKDEWKFANIGFQFQNYDKELRYGIAVKRDPDNFPEELRNEIYGLPNNTLKINNWWPWHRWMESPLGDWSKYEAWKAVQDGTMKNAMREKIIMLLKFIEGINL